MSDPYVRSIGRVEDLDGYPVAVGVDYDAVTIGVCKLDAGMQEEFAQLFVAAVWQAGRNRAAMTEDEGAGGRPLLAVEATGGASGGEPAAGTSRGSVSAAGELGMTDAEFERRLRLLMRVNPRLLETFLRDCARRGSLRPQVRLT
jgi:hypothetical protein